MAAWNQNAPERTRSMTAPDMIAAPVQPNSKKAPHSAPVMRSETLAPMVSAHGRLAAPASQSTPPVIPGPPGMAQ